MEKRFSDIFKHIMPLSKEKKEDLTQVSLYLEGSSFSDFKYWYKLGMISIGNAVIGSKKLGAQENYPVLAANDEDPELNDSCDAWNDKIAEKVRENTYKDFSEIAERKIKKLIAPNIIGLEDVKEAALLQLFAKEKVHLLLLGDPGTGKTDVLRSVAELAPKSSYGLGSGTSGAGLTVTVRGNEVIEGLLPMAHKGLCCIDELNLMKERDRAGFLNAMEKGFVTYDKANKHIQVKADIKVLATANPKGDRFAGWIIETLKKQLPFDPALLSRFHLVFLIKRPDVEGFVKITKKIISGEKEKTSEAEAAFVKDYIAHVNKLKVVFNKQLEPMITSFVEELKNDEEKFLIEISPRLVVGIVRLAKASARLNMRSEVNQDDVVKVLSLLKRALYIHK
ncbi:AAA family ATPase [Nanoarchaeota archaeon]